MGLKRGESNNSNKRSACSQSILNQTHSCGYSLSLSLSFSPTFTDTHNHESLSLSLTNTLNRSYTCRQPHTRLFTYTVIFSHLNP